MSNVCNVTKVLFWENFKIQNNFMQEKKKVHNLSKLSP